MPRVYRRRRRYRSSRFYRRPFRRVPRALRVGDGGTSVVVMRKLGDGGIAIPSNTIRTGMGGLITWKLQDIPGYSTWSSISSEYQITGIKMVFWIPGDENTARWYSADSITGQGIELAVSPVHSNVAHPVTRDDVLNNPHTKIRNLCYGPLKIFLRPSLLMEAFGGAADTDYTPAWGRWIQTSETDAPHYGLRYWVKFLYTSGTDPVFTDLGVYINYRVKYYVKFKGIRP